MERRCFVHAGTHKTGTTSLQDMLVRNAARFADAGVSIVRTGRPVALARSEFVGNQNLAWQIVGDRRFDPSAGTLADLTAELLVTTSPDAIVSSEDFVLAYDRPDALVAVREAVVAAGFKPITIVYLRDQLGYARSLYGMFVVRGKLPLLFSAFTEIVLRDALVGWAGSTFPFEFEHLIEPMIACFGRESTRVRPYRYGRTNGQLLADFVTDLALPIPTFEDGALEGPRLNESSSTLDVMTALHENLSATRAHLPSASEIARANGIPLAALEDRFAAGGDELEARFAARFARSNALVLDRTGCMVPEPDRRRVRDDSAARAFERACAEAWDRPA